MSDAELLQRLFAAVCVANFLLLFYTLRLIGDVSENLREVRRLRERWQEIHRQEASK